MRVFVAVPLTNEIKDEVAKAAAALRESMGDGVKWVDPKNYHLTMAFIGSIPESRIGDVERVIGGVSFPQKFNVKFCGVGVFPNLSKARVLWVGISEGNDALSKISAAISEKLKESKFDVDDKPFKPHMTIARFKTPAKIDRNILEEIEMNTEMTSDRVVLYKSELKPEGPIYSELYVKLLEDSKYRFEF